MPEFHGVVWALIVCGFVVAFGVAYKVERAVELLGRIAAKLDDIDDKLIDVADEAHVRRKDRRQDAMLAAGMDPADVFDD